MFLQRLPGHSYFAGPSWARVLEAAAIGVRCSALLGTDGGSEVLLPIAQRDSRFGVTDLRSMPWGTYGGPLLAGSSADDAAAELARHVRLTIQSGWLLATPGPWPHVALGRPLATYSTDLLDLTAGKDSLWKGLDKDARNQVRQAERAGVQVSVERSTEAYDEYYAMLEASARRWRRKDPGKPRSLFTAIATEAGDDARLWIARLEGRAAAGALCFYGKQEVFYWSGAMHAELSRVRANNLIQWRVIEHAAAAGFRTYNMGSSGHLEGVRKFKRAFGSQPCEYPAYFIGTGLFGLAPRAMKFIRQFRS